MKNFLISFLMGIILGGGGVWYFVERDRTPGLQDIGQRAETVRRNLNEVGAAAAGRAREILDAKLEALELDPGEIQEEMMRTGQVVRRKAREFGQAVAEAAADTRITAEIKAKLLRDSDLSAWDVSVTTTDGHVTLSGDVTSTEQVGRAILLSYETSGVREVTSVLQVKVRGVDGTGVRDVQSRTVAPSRDVVLSARLLDSGQDSVARNGTT